MRNIRKFFSLLVMVISISAQATFALDFPDGLQEVFNINLDGENFAFGIMRDNDTCSAIFFDGNRSEINLAICDASESKQLKKIAFESKMLVKSISTLKDYEQQNIYNQIVEKLKALAPVTFENYDSTDEFGFVKVTLLLSKSVQKKYPDAEEFFFGGTSNTNSTFSPLSKKLTVWSFTDELEGFLNKEGYGYKATHPDVEIEYELTPTDQFPSRLDPRIASGKDCPDVFALEDYFVRKYIESGQLLPLDDLYAEVKDKVNSYPVEVGSYDGHVYAMSWNVSPGALFYRRSLAKKYFGTDDPKVVQKKLKDFDTFLATARELKKLSGGKCRIVSSTEDLFHPFKGAREKPWVVDDRLVIDPAMEKYMDICRIFTEEELVAKDVSQWSEGWFAGMRGELNDDYAYDYYSDYYIESPVEIFCYFLPTWGLHYILKPNAPGTSGDWAMCQGPSAWRWGGTWIAAYKGTKNPEAAKELIRYLTTDDGFQEAMAKETGDIVTNIDVQDKIKDSFSEPYLSGQNHYAEFCKYTKKIKGTLEQATDWQIESIWHEAVMSYVSWERTKKQALQYFKDQVSFTMGF